MYKIYWSENIGPFDSDIKRSKSFDNQEAAGAYADMLDADPQVTNLHCSWLMTIEERKTLDAIPFA